MINWICGYIIKFKIADVLRGMEEGGKKMKHGVKDKEGYVFVCILSVKNA